MSVGTLGDVDSSSFAFAFDPFAIIAVSSFIGPHSVAMSLPIPPISDIVVSIGPLELACALFLMVFELSSINSRVINLTPFDFLVVLEGPLETTIFGQ